MATDCLYADGAPAHQYAARTIVADPWRLVHQHGVARRAVLRPQHGQHTDGKADFPRQQTAIGIKLQARDAELSN